MGEVSFFKELWELARTAGPFATLLLLFLYYRSDNERRQAQKQSYDLAVSGIKALHSVENALSSLRNTMTKGSRSRGQR